MTGLSRSQIDKLGVRLRSGSMSREDLELLQQVRAAHDDTLARATVLLRERLGLEPTSRLKTVNTIVEKLARERGRLSTMQDIAGARVVLDISRSEQDDLVKSIVELFPGAKVVDRRVKPSHGYRAVHVIVSMEDRLVEVQVRTELQNLWAQLMERLADQWGRQIRYGAPLDDPLAKVGDVTRQRVIDLVMRVAEAINMWETAGELLKSMTATIEEAHKSLPEGSEALVAMVERRAKLQSATASAHQELREILRDLDSIFGAGS